jgi:hypothetical protein
MADVSKCANGETCCLRLECYRYLVEPSARQSYIAPPLPGSNCEYYVPISSDYVLPFSRGKVGQPKLNDDC